MWDDYDDVLTSITILSSWVWYDDDDDVLTPHTILSSWVWTSPGVRWWAPRGWPPWLRAVLCSTRSLPRWLPCVMSPLTMSPLPGLPPRGWRGSLPAGAPLLPPPARQPPRMPECPGWGGHGARGEQPRSQVENRRMCNNFDVMPNLNCSTFLERRGCNWLDA